LTRKDHIEDAIDDALFSGNLDQACLERRTNLRTNTHVNCRYRKNCIESLARRDRKARSSKPLYDIENRGDYQPGLRCLHDHGLVSPLEVGF
jgi:hypothetical protein